jgi:hypothetical protein
MQQTNGCLRLPRFSHRVPHRHQRIHKRNSMALVMHEAIRYIGENPSSWSWLEENELSCAGVGVKVHASSPRDLPGIRNGRGLRQASHFSPRKTEPHHSHKETLRATITTWD